MNFNHIREKFDKLKADEAPVESIMSSIEEYVLAYYSGQQGRDDIAASTNPDITVNEVVDIVLQQVDRWLSE